MRLLSKEWTEESQDHDQDLLELLASVGVRAPDWSIAADWLEPAVRLGEGMEVPIKRPGETEVSGVYLFYDWTPSLDPSELSAGRIVEIPRHIVPLYVGKAANLWNRMQAHWARPQEGAWITTYFEEVEKDLLAGHLQACAWREEERAGMEARLLKRLRPRYCKRME
ncbi:GIY-YIG nuclease family protein [Mesoterricola sediminis]|uniref:hypothetical protein n=1 Tax=Mesoterricola sediminis TaxID=2927980 RepID=UPI00292F3FF8|nr:hypothetical protein [Mesoterricola sediminis]